MWKNKVLVNKQWNQLRLRVFNSLRQTQLALMYLKILISILPVLGKERTRTKVQ